MKKLKSVFFSAALAVAVFNTHGANAATLDMLSIIYIAGTNPVLITFTSMLETDPEGFRTVTPKPHPNALFMPGTIYLTEQPVTEPGEVGSSTIQSLGSVNVSSHNYSDVLTILQNPPPGNTIQAFFASDGLSQSNLNSFPVLLRTMTLFETGFPQDVSLFFFPNGGGSVTVESDSAPLPPLPTPLPAALPLFAGGLGVLGLLARRRKRKASAAIAAA